MQMPRADVLALARQIIADCDHCADPVQTAQILPAEAYVNDEFWDFEKWSIFSRQWLFVGHVNQVPKLRDYLALTVLDEPILITRDENNQVHVLSAICQHRGHPLVGGLKAQSVGAPCLNARNLVCPYHGWTYQLDGAFLWAPDMEQTTPLETLRREIRLPRIRSEIFHGLIFINFDDHARPLAPSLAKLEHEIAPFNIADMVPMAVRVDSDLRCNWKGHHENALEPYHTDYVHKRSHASAPANLSRFFEFSPGDGQIMTTTDFAAPDADLFSQVGKSAMPLIEGLRPEQRRRLLFVSILPTFFAVFQPSGVMLTLILPRGPSLMDTLRFPLYPKSTALAPNFAEQWQRQVTVQGTVIQEDIITQTSVQAGHHSRFTPRGRLSWLESPIPQMNRWLLERYRDALAQAPTG